MLDFVFGCFNFVIVVNIVEGFVVLVLGVIFWFDINVVIKLLVVFLFFVLLFMFMEKFVIVFIFVDCSVFFIEDIFKMFVFLFVENLVIVLMLIFVVFNVVFIEDGIVKFVVGVFVKNFGGVFEEEFLVLLLV